MQYTVIRIKYTTKKLDSAQQNQMPNVKSATSINYSPNRLPFIISKYSAKNHIPADIQLVGLFYTQM